MKSESFEDLKGLVHLVRDRMARGYNGIDFISVCGQHYGAGERWTGHAPERITCLRCVVAVG